MFNLLLVLGIAYIAFWLIAGADTGFRKPLDPKERPRWFFALWFSISLAIIFSMPITGYPAMDDGTKFALQAMLFICSLPVGVLITFIYKHTIKKSATETASSNKPTPRIPVKNNIVTNNVEPTAEDDAKFFLQATQEVETGRQNAAQWAKAMALCEGNMDKAKYKYINLRTQDLTSKVARGNNDKQHLAPQVKEPQNKLDGSLSAVEEADNSIEYNKKLEKALAVARNHANNQ